MNWKNKKTGEVIGCDKLIEKPINEQKKFNPTNESPYNNQFKKVIQLIKYQSHAIK